MTDPNAPNDSPPQNALAKIPSPKRRSGRRGGWLKSGNTVDVGRKPTAEVRNHILQTVDEATDLMYEILDGKFKEEIRDHNGVVVGHRTANIREIAAIYRCLCGHALPSQREVVAPEADIESQPAFTEHANRIWRAEAIDAMDAEELAWVKRIEAKMQAKRIEWENSESYRTFVEWYRRHGPQEF